MKKNTRSPNKIQQLFVSLFMVAGLSSCAMLQPQELSEQAMLDTGRYDRILATKDTSPVLGELTLEEAIARALKYNLELRTRMMEQTLALQQLSVDNYDMLPDLLSKAGYFNRNRDRTTQSRNIETNELSPSRFISQERNHFIFERGISWSLLDFGVSYFNSRQQGDKVMMAYENRRKTMNLLIQDVTIAFWRAASAQKLQEQIVVAITFAEKALFDARQNEADRVRNPVDSLRYQRQILENLRLLEAIAQELSTAQVELASLINAPFVTPLKVKEPKMEVSKTLLDMPVEKMEELAMANNPAIREQHYNADIARIESRKTLVQLFPNLSLNYSINYDTDDYLVNNKWNEVGAQLSFNLLNILTGPSQLKLAEAGVKLADQRRMTVQMAVLVQLHLARLELANTIKQLDRSVEISTVDESIADHTRNRQEAGIQTRLEQVSGDTGAILSLLRRYQALSEAQAAAARLQFTLGLEPEIESLDDISLEDLMKKIITMGEVLVPATEQTQPMMPDE